MAGIIKVSFSMSAKAAEAVVDEAVTGEAIVDEKAINKILLMMF